MDNSNNLPSTYSMTMHRCLRVSKEQNIETTNGFSAKVRMSRSTNTCWIWFRRIRFCRLIFFMANRWRVSLWRTRNTALHGKKRKKECKRRERRTITGQMGYDGFIRYWSVFREINWEILQEKEEMRKHAHQSTILQQHILILVSFPLLLGSLWRPQRNWRSRIPTEKLTHRRHC